MQIASQMVLYCLVKYRLAFFKGGFADHKAVTQKKLHPGQLQVSQNGTNGIWLVMKDKNKKSCHEGSIR
jgi:hypothetical protein